MNGNNISELKKHFDRARKKYRPEKVKYLLIAEAPPDNLNRFFYYESVIQHDYLFLGIAQSLFPKLKNLYIESNRNPKIKEIILKRFQHNGFYLLDLSPVPLSLLETSLSSQMLYLQKNIKDVIDKETKIILIKTNVYDIAFETLNLNFKNVANCRIPFPGQGWQKEFQIMFKKALDI